MMYQEKKNLEIFDWHALSVSTHKCDVFLAPYDILQDEPVATFNGPEAKHHAAVFVAALNREQAAKNVVKNFEVRHDTV